jgi:CheY-like chemotaxis protein
MRLLIADDDSVTRLNLSAAGERFGHEVTAEADGRAAWDAFQRGGYSVVDLGLGHAGNGRDGAVPAGPGLAE